MQRARLFITSTWRPPLLAVGLAAFLSACGGSNEAETPASLPQPTAVQAAADRAVQRGLVGVAFGQVKPDSVKMGLAGVQRLGTVEPIESGNLFLLGSNAKAMTASVAARLVERGALAWTTRLAEAMPDVASGMHPAYQSVTLEHLLDHRGGVLGMNKEEHLERFFLHLQANGEPLPIDKEQRKKFFATWLLALTPEPGVTPGSSFVYSNAGYVLAAMMLERVAGAPFEQLLHDEMTAPLGVPVHWVRGDALPLRGPSGHVGLVGGTPRPLTAISVDEANWEEVLHAAGPALALNPLAYSEWVRWHLKALQGLATPLPRSYVQRLQSLRPGEYGLGWVAQRRSDGRTVLLHSGEWRGFASHLSVQQSGSTGIFALTNVVDAASADHEDSSWVFKVLATEVHGLQ